MVFKFLAGPPPMLALCSAWPATSETMTMPELTGMSPEAAARFARRWAAKQARFALADRAAPASTAQAADGPVPDVRERDHARALFMQAMQRAAARGPRV